VVPYRAYQVGEAGRYVSGLDLDCADDQEAIEAARQFVDSYDVELWQGSRKVALLLVQRRHRGEDAGVSDRESILEVIRRAYDARGKGDLDALMAAFHQDAVFTLIGDKKALEVTGSVHGHDAVREALRDFIATFDFVDRQILSEVVEGDRAAVHSCIVVRYGPTRQTWSADVLDLLTFKDGKIIELIEFADTAQIRDMMSRAAESRPVA
jgi:ketosteroid isomerase-like protein